MKRILIAALMALTAIAQNTVTLTAVPPPPVNDLGAGVVGTAGTVTACYWVVINYVGGGVLAAAPVCPNNVPGTLSGSNYVLLTWQAASGTSITYDVLKTSTPTPPLPGATVAIATGLTTVSYQDQGGGLSPYTTAAFPYANASALIRLNNQDFTVPTFEYISGGSIQGAFGQIVPKTNALKLGSRTNPFTIDNTGAAFEANPNGTPTAGNVVSTAVNLTLAQVNAGAVIVPAVTGQTFKIQHVLMQAVGGSTAGCTLVEVTDTAGTPIVGISFTVAILTSGAFVNEASGAGTTVTTFAPTALTASQGIQVIKTGSACTTATSFNVVVFYTINS